MANVKLVNINKIYDNKVQAVYDFNLEIKDNEFIVFVGPSGCGKSTTLRMIAGLEDITSGELYINNQLSNDISPKSRDIAMVFQNYALYPHMSVYENMAFGLKNRHVPKDEIDRRIQEAAEILDIKQYLQRKPKALSGGQQQRVALGRAIVRNAQVFLMDEPLSNLDAKLRVQMRSEIIKLHERLKTTTIYVTHDQTEAMTMATRIVVMKKGFIQQIGSPKEIYLHPANQFVAGFIGSPSMNFIPSHINEDYTYNFFDSIFPISEDNDFHEKLKDYVSKDVTLGIRPEDIILADENATHFIEVESDVVEMMGDILLVHFKKDDTIFSAKISSDYEVLPHQTYKIAFKEKKIHFFDKETEITII